MALTLETMLAPVSDDNPVGDDLSYDNERQRIEQAFEAASAGATGDEGPDWREVQKLIEAQASRTKDLWLAVYLCRAGARGGSLPLIELGSQALAGLMETYWDTVHPQLEELGLPGRKAACDSLASRGEFIMPLERVALLAHPRLGTFSGADVERFRAGQEAADGDGMFRAALEDMGDAVLEEAIGRLANIEDGLRRADKVFTAAAAGEPSPNYGPTYAQLGGFRQALASFLVGGAAAAEAEAEEGAAAEGGAAAGRAAAPAEKRISGRVDSREDVIKALDSIADYYRRSEPSHPLMLWTQRAKHWVTMEFMDLIRDIAPEGRQQAFSLLNKRREEE